MRSAIARWLTDNSGPDVRKVEGIDDKGGRWTLAGQIDSSGSTVRACVIRPASWEREWSAREVEGGWEVSNGRAHQ